MKVVAIASSLDPRGAKAVLGLLDHPATRKEWQWAYRRQRCEGDSQQSLESLRQTSIDFGFMPKADFFLLPDQMPFSTAYTLSLATAFLASARARQLRILRIAPMDH